jgi:hypothetical protein
MGGLGTANDAACVRRTDSQPGGHFADETLAALFEQTEQAQYRQIDASRDVIGFDDHDD